MNTSLIYKDLLVEGFSMRLKVYNILDKLYFHPGIKSADAGETAGYWNGNVWYGSQGWLSSKLPQPHRYFMLSLILNL